VYRLKVKDIARKKGLSQRQLILRSGLDTRVVQRVLRDDHANITLATLDRIAGVLDVDISELIESIPAQEQEQ
jgi:transcriptional regulator with XRE-family HTH domain